MARESKGPHPSPSGQARELVWVLRSGPTDLRRPTTPARPATSPEFAAKYLQSTCAHTHTEEVPAHYFQLIRRKGCPPSVSVLTE